MVGAIIDRLDISEIEAAYAGGGTSSYNPGILLKVQYIDGTMIESGANEVSGVLSEASCCRCGAPLI